MQKEIKVSIVIPNYNGKELLKKNIPHVLTAYENKKNRIIEIIIVDDASSDDSVALLKNNFPKVKVYKHTKNLLDFDKTNMVYQKCHQDSRQCTTGETKLSLAAFLFSTTFTLATTPGY